MAKVGNGRSAGFVGRLAALRQAQGPAGRDKGAAPGAGPAPAAAGKLGAPLAEAGLDDKLIRRFGKDLRGAVGGLGKLAAAERGLEAWQARSYGRVLKQSHKVLGALLGALPAEQRADGARITAEAWGRLAARPDLGGRLPFALSAASGLVDSAVRMEARRKLDFTPEQLAAVADGATAEVEALLEDAAGRDGLTTMLNVLPRLVEELELAADGLDAEARAALVRDVRIFMQDTLPRSGLTLADASDLARAVSVHARKGAQDPKDVLEAAKADFLAARQEGLQAAKGGLAEAPDPAVAPLVEALRAALDENPAGPSSLFEAAPRLNGVFAQMLAQAGQEPNRRNALEQIAAFLHRSASTPSAESALRFVEKYGAQLAARPELAVALGEAAGAGDDAASAKAVLSAVHAVFNRPVGAPWQEAVANLDDLAPAEACKVAFAAASVADRTHSDGDLLAALAQQVRAGAGASAADLARFAARWAQAAPHVAQNAQRGATLAAVVAEAQGEQIDTNRVRNAVAMAQQVAANLPGLDAAALIRPGADGSDGIWALADAQGGWATQPSYILQQLLRGLNGAPGGSPEQLARLAMKVTESAARIQNGQQVHVPRIVRDFQTAAKTPQNLKSAAGAKGQVALRAEQQQPSLQRFVDAHPALPVDFAATAGLELTPDQLTWASELLDNAHGLELGRLLRDCVFGCKDLNRMDLVEALRTTKSEGKAVRAVIREVAQAYRVRQLNTVPVDALVKGLAEGGDPVAAAAAEKAKGAFGDLDLVALAGGKIDNPAGLEEIHGLADNIADLLQQYRSEFKSMDHQIDMGKLRPVLDGALASVLKGTWPAPKYEDEVGQRQLAVLSPEQRAIWRQSTVIGAAGAAPAVDAGPILEEGAAVARGLAKLIPERVELPEGAKFDAETVARLRGELAETVEALRAAEKGSDAHRALSVKAGPLAQTLAIVELQVALHAVGEDNPKAALEGLAPLIPAGARALRKLGESVAAATLTDLGYSLEDLKPAEVKPGTGKWAADQDSLTAMIDSHKSGCLSKGSKLRRWGLAGSLVDANTKMIRVFNGENQTYRTFLRMLPVKFGNYEGPALFIENPVGDRGGNNEDRQLLEDVLLEKARQMGVPALGGQARAPEGWKVVPNGQATLTFDPGHTGLYHSDRTGQQIHQGAEQPWQVQSRALAICVPPALADKV